MKQKKEKKKKNFKKKENGVIFAMTIPFPYIFSISFAKNLIIICHQKLFLEVYQLLDRLNISFVLLKTKIWK